ncbi:hypothetical protein CDL15_Pgr015134 [Punica granatum]|nr:hypothetical protein CDL15_Pgr015134 [Punica granatum]PKI37310.1 hypothetical protein CRG98_042305 [Punica granatum]
MGNEGGSSINSDHHHQQQQQQQLGNVTSSSIPNQPGRTNNLFVHRDTHNYGLLRPQQPPFELNKPADLALHYSGHLQPSQYSLFPASSQTLIPSPQKPLGGYDYASTRDCESGSNSFRYGGSHHQQQACEPGLEVGTCEAAQAQSQSIVGGGSANCRDNTGINNEWAMLVAPHHTGNDPHPHQHQQDSSKGMRFEIEDANPSTVPPHMSQLSARGEMDFWGYTAK